jgi:hypothetical protein
MGTLFYGASRTPIRIDDRILAHLKLVATSKLRRNEPFLVSWHDASDVGGGRSSIWIHPTCDLHYKFDGGTPATIDQELIEQLSVAANAARGIEIDEATLR